MGLTDQDVMRMDGLQQTKPVKTYTDSDVMQMDSQPTPPPIKNNSQSNLKSVYPYQTETERGGTSPLDVGLSTLEKTAQDVGTIGAHWGNQFLMNYPRSLTQAAGYKYPEDTSNPVAGVAAKTAGVIGAIQNPLAKALGLGAPGSSLLQNIGAGAATGAAYAPTDNPVGLKERGIQGLFGAALPVGIKGASKIGEVIPQGIKNAGLGMVEEAIKRFPKYASYGKNPAEGIVGEGITGATPEEIQFKLQNRLEELRQQKQQILSSPQNAGKYVDASNLLDSLEAAKKTALGTPNSDALAGRIQEAIGKVNSEVGDKDLSHLSLQEADLLKQKIGGWTKFTGLPSDDQAYNSALKQTYGNLMGRIEDQVPEIRDTNSRFGNVLSANQALEQGDMFSGKMGKGSNIGQRAGFYTILGSIPALLAGHPDLARNLLVGGLGEEAAVGAINTPAFKTNVAKGLYGTGEKLQSAGENTSGFIQKLLNKVRGIQEPQAPQVQPNALQAPYTPPTRGAGPYNPPGQMLPPSNPPYAPNPQIGSGLEYNPPGAIPPLQEVNPPNIPYGQPYESIPGQKDVYIPLNESPYESPKISLKSLAKKRKK